MNLLKNLTACFCLLLTLPLTAQIKPEWNNKQCAVVLTYDDAINIDLDNVVPALDSLTLKGTFYLIGSSSVVTNRLKEWRKVALTGHELGNHSLFHPCDGSLPGRGFVTAETDLSKYTLDRVVKEVRATNTLLTAIDGKTERTFAFPCGDLKIGNQNYYDLLKNDFIGARGINGGLQVVKDINLNNIDSYMINGQAAPYMISLVNEAIRTHTLLVFLFHGVGGGHTLNVSLEAHSKLLHYLKQHESEIWIAPMVEVAQYIKTGQAIQK